MTSTRAPRDPLHVPDPRRSAQGKAAIRARWGPQRHVRLTDLDPVTAGIIRAILTAAENAKKAKAEADAKVAS